jgi:hypothetical protein
VAVQISAQSRHSRMHLTISGQVLLAQVIVGVGKLTQVKRWTLAFI